MTEQRRKHLRLPIESMIFIEPLISRPGRDESSRMIMCKSLNVSRGGLQVILEEELTVGTILQIGVELPGEKDRLCLAAAVRWCLPSKNEQNPWMAGFQILNANDSDIERWVASIVALEN